MMSHTFLLPTLLFLPIASTAHASIVQRTTLPIIDLGYERHQAISFNESAGWYNFSNIRYAQPPTGNLRFRAPLPPEGSSAETNNGSVGRTCPQASGAWTQIAKLFALSQTLGTAFNYTAALSSLPGAAVPESAEYDARTTEDCLFLDVYAPSGVFDSGVTGLPVLVWLHGGGYTSGEKNGDGQFDPSGLMSASNNSLIFVAINYRLGAFGWLAGTSIEADGTANAGLYDQALAFRWVRNHIHLFGGDASRVTAIGKSSGAGSLMHQVTSFGGDTSSADKIPAFQHAIITSPAFLPSANRSRSEQTLQQFLALLNVTTLAAARDLPTDALIRANALQIYNSTYGSNSFGPAVDTSIAPDLPGKLLLEGRFHKNLTLAVSHNANEALTFTDPRINSTISYADFLLTAFPDIPAASAAHVEDELYPPVFDGSKGYSSGFQRAVKTVADAAFVCNAFYLSSAFANASYACEFFPAVTSGADWCEGEFSVPPGIHGQDTSYIFPAATGGSGALLGLNRTVAVALREYIASFAVAGVPAARDGVAIPAYGAGNRMANLTDAGIGVVRDDTANERCVWWQKGEYVGAADGGGQNASSTNGTGDGSGSDHASGSEKVRPWQVVIAILVILPLLLI